MTEKKGKREIYEEVASKLNIKQEVSGEVEPDNAQTDPTDTKPAADLTTGGAKFSTTPSGSSVPTETAEEHSSKPPSGAVKIDAVASMSAVGRAGNEAAEPEADDQLGLEVARETPRHSACLNVHSVARAISTFIRAVPDEMTFGVFGPWGRGKTYLTQFIEDDLKAANYEVVRLNAWKHSKSPEIWGHLYQTVARAAEANVFDRIPIAFRTGLARDGLWRLVLIGLSFGLGLVPLMAVFAKSAILISWFLGIGTVMLLWRLFSTGQRTLREIQRQFLSLANHDEKLGVQGIIGRDLSALLKGWVLRREWDARWAYLFVSIGLTANLSFFFHWLLSQPDPFEGAYFPVEIASPDPLSTTLSLVIWNCTILLTGILLFVRFKNIERVLLVVDDLDRCEPCLILDVIESLKVLLEDDVIKERMQVLMLVEEDVLRNRIEDKYKTLFQFESGSLSSDDDAQSTDLKKIVRQHIEKLFLCHYRMLPLSADEITEITDVYLNSSNRYSVKNNGSGEVVHQLTDSNDFDESDEEIRTSRLPEFNVVHSNPFSHTEKTLLRTVSTEKSMLDESRGSPRSIRSWLNRYQLARLLCDAHAHKPNARYLAEALWDGISSVPADRFNQTVVRQLMWDRSEKVKGE